MRELSRRYCSMLGWTALSRKHSIEEQIEEQIERKGKARSRTILQFEGTFLFSFG